MKIMAGDEAWELVEFDPLENVADKAQLPRAVGRICPPRLSREACPDAQ